MKIGINLMPYTYGRQGGAEVYIRNLIWALGDVEFKQHTFVLFVSPHNKGMYSPSCPNFSEVVLPTWFNRNRFFRIAGEQAILPLYVSRQNVDVLFSNYVCLFGTKTAQIINIHDMLYKRLPSTVEKTKLLYWRVAIPLSIWKSKRVMTVSHSSAKDIALYFPSSKKKLFVTVEGVNRDLLIWQAVDSFVARTRFGLESRYLMSSATFGKHKNIPTLIRAFAKIKSRYPDIKLVLTGGANTGDAAKEHASLKQLVLELDITDSVIFTGYVSEELLVSLYKGATLYVIPSYYEGFGLSVIEAQHFGTPVVCSDAEALVEVGGDGVISVPAVSYDAFANAISCLLDDEMKRTRLREVGYENIKRYNWHQAALDLIAVCESIRK